MLNRVTLIIALLLCSALAYRSYLADHSDNPNTAVPTQVSNNETRQTSKHLVESSHTQAPQSSQPTCASPLYVSDVLTNTNQYDTHSLISLLRYFKEEKQDTDEVREILEYSGLYAQQVVDEAALVFEPPALLTQKVDDTQISANIKKIEYFNGDYPALASAVERGDLDANIDLSFMPGQPLSVVDYLLVYGGKRPDIAVFKTLIEAGVPIRPNTVITASKSKIPTVLLSLMLQHLSDSDRDYQYQSFLDRKFNYTYTSYAARHSTLASLKLILAEPLGDKSDAINALLKAKLADDKKPKSLDIERIAKTNKLFNDKLELLFEHDIPVDPQLASEVLKNTKALNEQNRALILTASKSTAPEPFYAGDAVLKVRVLEYATALKKAHDLWPEFIFSYDADCHKVAANSHYRFDNLIDKSVINDLMNNNKTANKQTQINAIKQLGDIYVDWYIKNYTWSEMGKDKTVKPDRTNHELEEIKGTIRSHIAFGEWTKISDILTSNAIPLDYVYSKNRHLIESSIFRQPPQHVLFDWFSRGVPIRNSTLDDLISIDEYAEFTFELIKNGKLINKSRKSMIFQAARNANLPLLKLLLNPALNNESYNHNIGLSALNWTLLNYNDDLKQQLALLQTK
ncbi:MAG: hypothetical protein HRT35_16475 [Algicola sp.]|nr:hypothetical protein [Algicola sp.]